MRTIIAILASTGALALAQELPATMTRLMVKLESTDVPKDSFAAQAKRMYRAGAGYCRIEENPDLANGIHGLLIMNEPDSWLVNRLDKTAKHLLDHGPTFNCRMPIFGYVEEIKSAADAKKPLLELEFGREIEFFHSRSGPPQPGPEIHGKPTTVYSTTIGDSELFLFVSGKPATPVSVVRKDSKIREIIWYGEFMQVPFDARLFAKPEGVKMEEIQ